MSADDDGGPGEREVAHRLFAAEFEDATLEYSETDEDRAPNYVVTPTGARVNRLFVAGVLTEVETVNENTLRGRVVDPTGAFVTYAGQYQPDEVAFLDRTTPPAFVSLTGKGRTFQPEDSDVVYSSVRPERLSEVNADTRDAWVVDAAEATLRRIAVAAAAREMDARGDTLRDRLVEAGVDESLAAGVSLALDHYGTTASYLESLRTVATEALAVVADERDEVSATTVAPDAADGQTLGPLPEKFVLAAGDESTSGDAATATTDASVTADADTDEVETTGSDETVGAGDEVVESGTTDETVDAVTTGQTDDGETEPTTETEASPETGTTTEADDLGGFDDTGSSVASTGRDDTTGGELGGFDESSVTDTDDELGGFDDSEPASSDGDESAEPSFDEDDLDDALTDEEREAVRSEHGVGFSSGTEVPDPEESELDAPDPEEITPEPDSDTASVGEPSTESPPESSSAETTPEGGVGSSTGTDDAAADTTTSAGAPDTTPDAGTADTAPDAGTADTTPDDDPDPTDVDLQSAVVEIMGELNDGDGADREEVMAVAVDRHGADPAAAEEAIQEALMSGQCYEAGGGLKPI